MRHPVLRVRGEGAGDVDDVRHHRRGGGQGTGTGAVVEGGTHGVALHQHGVHHAVHVGDEAPLGDQGGMDAQLYATPGAAGDAQVLDAVTQLLGIDHVLGLDPADALGVTPVELEWNAEGQGSEDGELVCRVDAFHVEGGIGLGIAQCLGLLEHVGELTSLVAHLGEDEVAGTVDDAGDPLDVVGRQPFTQRLDDGDATGHRRLEGHGDALALRRLENLIAVGGDERLVGGDHVLAVLDGLEHQLPRRRVASDELHHDVHLGVLHHLEGVLGDLHRFQPVDAGGIEVSRRRVHHADFAPGTAADLGGIPVQHVHGATTHGAQSQQSYFNGFQFCFLLVNVRSGVHFPISKVPLRGLCKSFWPGRSFISECRGMAERLFKAGLCHHECLPPSLKRTHP